MKHILLFALALPLLGQDHQLPVGTCKLPDCPTGSKILFAEPGTSIALPGTITLSSATVISTARFCRTINGASKCLEIHADGKIVQPDTTRMSYREIVQWIIDSLKEQRK